MAGTFLEILISEVEKRPFLYNPSDAGHSDTGKTFNGWNAVATVLRNSGFEDATGDYCRTEFGKLKEKFRAERKERKRPTGSGRKRRSQPFPFYEQMMFLNDVIKERTRSSNLLKKSISAIHRLPGTAKLVTISHQDSMARAYSSL